MTRMCGERSTYGMSARSPLIDIRPNGHGRRPGHARTTAPPGVDGSPGMLIA